MRKFLTFLIGVMLVTAFSGIASAGSGFWIQYPAGTNLFTVDSGGNVNITTGYLNVSASWIAEGGISLTDKYLLSAGDTMTGELIVDGYNITVVGGNVTAEYFMGSGLFLTNVNATTIVCLGEEDVLLGNGSCMDVDELPSTAADFTNVAFVNESNVFTQHQNFTAINISDGAIYLNGISNITRNGVGSNYNIDSSGNHIFILSTIISLLGSLF